MGLVRNINQLVNSLSTLHGMSRMLQNILQCFQGPVRVSVWSTRHGCNMDRPPLPPPRLLSIEAGLCGRSSLTVPGDQLNQLLSGEARLRGHSGLDMPADQPHQLDQYGRKLDLEKFGRPPIPQIQVEILQDALRDYLQGAKAIGRKPKETTESLEKVLDWAKGKAWKIGSRNALDRIIRPVYRTLWPES